MPPYYQAIKYSNYILIIRLVSMAIIFLLLYFSYLKNRDKYDKTTIWNSIAKATSIYFIVLLPKIVASFLIFRVNIAFEITLMNTNAFILRIVKAYSMEFISYIFLISLFLFFFEKWGEFSIKISFSLSILTLIIMFIYPTVIRPIFFNARIVKSDELNKDIKKLSKEFEIQIENIYVINASKYTKRSNAYIFGLFSTLQVVVYDNLLKKFPKKEILAILAHEFAHYKLKHLYMMFFATTIFIFLGFGIVEKLFKMDREQFDNIEYPYLVKSDIYRFLLISFIVLQVLNIFGHYVERHGEAEADRCAVHVTGIKKDLIQSLKHLYLDSLTHPDPHPILKILFYTHFPPKERIELIRKEL